MNLNKKVVSISLVGIIISLAAMNSVVLNLCNKTDYICRTNMDKVEHIFYFFPFILLFSLLTLFLKKDSFNYWWKFSRISIPLVFLALFIMSLELHHSPGGWFNTDDIKDLILYVIIYGTFILGSIIQIYRGYRR